MRVAAVWGTTVVGLRMLERGESFALGDEPEAVLPIPDGLQISPAPVRAAANGWELDPRGAVNGTIALRGRTEDAAALARVGAPVPIMPGDYGLLQYGQFAIFFQYTPQADRLKTGYFGPELLAVLAIFSSTVFHIGVLGLIRTLMTPPPIPKPIELTNPDELASRFGLKRAMIEEPPPPTPGEDKGGGQGVKDPGMRDKPDKGAKMPNPEGKLGVKGPHDRAEVPGEIRKGTHIGGLTEVLDGETGKVLWQKETKRCMAASPAIADGVLYVALMDPSPCKEPDTSAPGYVLALDAATGKEKWRFEAGVVESSPLVVDGTIYVGSWDRNVWAIDAATGKPRWSYPTGDRVKGSVSFRNGVVYVGSYDGKLYALDARTGKLRWRASGRSGILSGSRFYSTPALAYGRVFVGDLNGSVYAYGAQTGDLIWARSTGKYVYSSPAVWNKTVYVGSYDGKLYAFDAATGDTRWEFDARGPISGSPVVMAGLVYVSTFAERTYAVDAATGKKVWEFKDGQYSPIVTDGERVYLAGHVRLFALEPGS